MKAVLVIDIHDDVAKNYKEFTVNYDLRGDYGEWDESVKYVEYCPLKPMPEKLYVEANQIEDIMPSEFDIDKWTLKIKLDVDKIFAFGWNACIDKILNDE